MKVKIKQSQEQRWAVKAINRVKKRGKYFVDLNVGDIKIPEKCPVLGIPLVIGRKPYYNSPSVDRIDNNKGYYKSNIRIISNAANNFKSDMPLELWDKFSGRLYLNDNILKYNNRKKKNRVQNKTRISITLDKELYNVLHKKLKLSKVINHLLWVEYGDLRRENNENNKRDN